MSESSSLHPSQFFHLYHTKSETLIERLNWTQLNAVCRTINASAYIDYYFWTTNNSKWLPLPAAIDNILQTTDLKRYPPAPPVTYGDENTATKHQLFDAPEERRRYQRFKKDLNGILDVGGRVIKLETVDISFGGAMLSESIQLDKNSEYGFAHLKVDDQQLEFKFRPIYVDKKDEFKSIEFISCSDLKAWKAYLDYLLKMNVTIV